MTDNEIIKGLEVCVGIHNDCEDCPLLECSQATDECMTELMNNALDLINRQKEEIERLSDRNHKCIYLSDEESIEYCVDGPCPNFKIESQIKAEAVKEFAEKVKKYCEDVIVFDDWYEESKLIDYIDNLVKEMVGEG